MTLHPDSHLHVARVKQFGPGSESASVTLRSGQGEVIAFCFPCSANEGTRVPNRLHALDAPLLQAAYLDDWPASQRDLASMERLDHVGNYAYSGCGKVVDAAEGLVVALGFVLDFGETPAGAEHVEFQVTRLDLR